MGDIHSSLDKGYHVDMGGDEPVIWWRKFLPRATSGNQPQYNRTNTG